MDELMKVALIEAAVLAVFVGVLVESIKAAFLPNDRLKKALPLIAIGLGIVLGVTYAIIRQEDLLLYAASGMLAGGFASGVYDAIHLNTRKGG